MEPTHNYLEVRLPDGSPIARLWTTYSDVVGSQSRPSTPGECAIVNQGVPTEASVRNAPTLYRNRVAWLVVTVFFDFLFLLTGGLALNTSAPAAGRAAGAVIAFVTAMWLVWAYRCGMVCDEHGVTVRQYSGRRVGVPWTHVAGFRLDRPMSAYGGGEWISLVLDDGRVVRSQNLCALAAGRDWARHVVEELEGQRRTHE